MDTVSQARAALDAGNLPLAHNLIRDGLEFKGQTDALLDLLAQTLEAMMLPEHASRARALHGAVTGAGHIARPAGDRYLVIREWGAGFWSDVDHVLTQLLVAEVTGRTPVVFWGEMSRFRGAQLGAYESAWDAFFHTVSHADIRVLNEQARAHPDDVWPVRWQGASLVGPMPNRWGSVGSRTSGAELLGREESVVVGDFYTSINELLPLLTQSHPLCGMPWRTAYRYLVAKYARPLQAHLRAADEFAAAQLAQRPALAVHVRGTDKFTEAKDMGDLRRQLLGLAGALDQRHRFAKIFLMTDDEAVLKEWSGATGNRLVRTSATRTTGRVGVHFLPGRDGEKLGREVLLDVLIACRCDLFVGMLPSNLSFMTWMMKDWAESHVSTIGAPMQLGRNSAIHEQSFVMQEKL